MNKLCSALHCAALLTVEMQLINANLPDSELEAVRNKDQYEDARHEQ